MKKMHTYFYLLLLLTGFVQIAATEGESTTKSYSEMSKDELNDALMEAIREGLSGIVKKTIQAGADVNYVNQRGDTPLISGIDHAGGGVWRFSRDGKYLLKWENGARIIEILLAAKANVNLANKQGNTPLIQSANKSDHKTLQDLLQIPGIKIDHVNEYGDTALIVAIKKIRVNFIVGDRQDASRCRNSQEIITTLLAVPGIDKKHANKNGDTAASLYKKVLESMPKGY
ncbi:MAG: ankyrin repeat domain-containing protein [Candidatus Dependentiae bacterium]|nr:ankyrin repeat domain-containing protein [Candidatus Dependentiae bacterium]